MHVYTIPAGHPILVSGTVDPITRQRFRVGDRIVVCQHCRCAYLVSSWELISKRCRSHGGRDNTFADLSGLWNPVGRAQRSARPESGSGSNGGATAETPSVGHRPHITHPRHGLREGGMRSPGPGDSPRPRRPRVRLLETVTRPRHARPTVRLEVERVRPTAWTEPAPSSPPSANPSPAGSRSKQGNAAYAWWIAAAAILTALLAVAWAVLQ